MWTIVLIFGVLAPLSNASAISWRPVLVVEKSAIPGENHRPRNIWTLHMSNNLPERAQILCHAHIICITVLEHRTFYCQIFCELILKSAFERIVILMQMILVKIKWHIKWKYLIKKFHDICLSYYFSNINFIITCKVSTYVPGMFIHLTTLIYYISLHLLLHSTLHYWLI